MADNDAIESMLPDYDSLTAWEKFADTEERQLTEAEFSGHPMLVWSHVLIYKGKKVGKVPHQIGLGKARALVQYHSDVYLFAQSGGTDTALPHNLTNSKSKSSPHTDSYRGNATLYLPTTGKPFSFGLKFAVLYAQYIDQIQQFVKTHSKTTEPAAVEAPIPQPIEEPAISEAEVNTMVEMWIAESLTRMTPMLPATIEDRPGLITRNAEYYVMRYPTRNTEPSRVKDWTGRDVTFLEVTIAQTRPTLYAQIKYCKGRNGYTWMKGYWEYATETEPIPLGAGDAPAPSLSDMGKPTTFAEGNRFKARPQIAVPASGNVLTLRMQGEAPVPQSMPLPGFDVDNGADNTAPTTASPAETEEQSYRELIIDLAKAHILEHGPITITTYTSSVKVAEVKLIQDRFRFRAASSLTRWYWGTTSELDQVAKAIGMPSVFDMEHPEPEVDLLAEAIKDAAMKTDQPILNSSGGQCVVCGKAAMYLGSKGRCEECIDKPAPTTKEVYQCEAHQCTPLQAAERFASTYFNEARPIEWHRMNGDILEFALLDGVTTYEVQYRVGVHLVSPDVYVVLRRITRE